MSSAYRVSRDVGVTVGADGLTLYVASLPAGPLVVLEGAAAVIWSQATSGPADGWVGRVADAVGRSEAEITADTEAFVADLCTRGLVRPS